MSSSSSITEQITSAMDAMTTAPGGGPPGGTQLPPLANKFRWEDYTVFAVSLFITLFIGLVFAVKDKWLTQSSESYLMGDRNNSFLPVAMSLLATMMNAIFIVGMTSTIYYFGMEACLFAIGTLFGNLVCIFFAIPMYHHMGYKFVSAYEYFEKRFHVVVRVIGSLVFMVGILLYLAVVLYAPSLTFLQVAHLDNVYLVIFIIGLICAVYTAFGGIRAVLWTDTVQMLILVGAMVAFTVTSLNKAGGLQHAWTVWSSNTSMRHRMDDWSTVFWERQSVLTLTFAYGITWGSVIASNQMMIQRYMAVSSMYKAMLAKFVGWIFLFALFVMVTLIAIAMFAYYDCEPLMQRFAGPGYGIQKPDQLVPFFIMDTMSDWAGFPGLLVAGMFAAALSTVSSCVNSLAAVFLEDIIKPFHRMVTKRPLSDKTSGTVARVLGIVFGLLSIVVAMGADQLGQFLLPIVVNVYGLMGAPLFGVFILGWMFPIAETIGALVGMLGSLGFGIYLFYVNIMYDSKMGWDQKKPNLRGCSAAVFKNMPRPPPPPTGAPTIADMSYLWHGPIMLAVCVVVGVVVSLFVTCIKKLMCKNRMTPLKARLLFSYGNNCCCCCDEDIRQGIDCGYKHGNSGIFCKSDYPDDEDEEEIGLQNGDSIKTKGFDNSAYMTKL